MPIGCNATIAAPHAHCIALQSLHSTGRLKRGARVLDIGSGSGFVTTCMALLVAPTGSVYGVEHAASLCQQARQSSARYAAGGAAQLQFVCGDGLQGLESEAPFDVIHVGAAVLGQETEGRERAEDGSVTPAVVLRLLQQLKPGGVMLVPVQTDSSQQQELRLYTRLPASAASPSAARYESRLVMFGSYAPLRAEPPAASSALLSEHQQLTDALEQQVQELKAEIVRWHADFKQRQGTNPSEQVRAADAQLQRCLQEWRSKTKEVELRRRREEQARAEAKKR